MLCNEKQHSAKNERDIQWTAAGIYSGKHEYVFSWVVYVIPLSRWSRYGIAHLCCNVAESNSLFWKTVAGITSFILALARNTDVLRRIHAEIDEVIGSDRLPTLEDRQSLPYLEAAYTESMRKYPIAPMGEFPYPILFGRGVPPDGMVMYYSTPSRRNWRWRPRRLLYSQRSYCICQCLVSSMKYLFPFPVSISCKGNTAETPKFILILRSSYQIVS